MSFLICLLISVLALGNVCLNFLFLVLPSLHPVLFVSPEGGGIFTRIGRAP